MATIPIAPPVQDRFSSAATEGRPASGNLSTAQTGNSNSTNIVDRGPERGLAQLKIVSTIGATPTVTVAIEGSLDGSDWSPAAYTDTPISALSIATFTITTATTTRKFLPANQPWRFLRLVYSANTNVTLTADVLV